MFSKLVRLGCDTSVKFSDSGTAYAHLAVVYDIGWGENKKAQWVEATVFGKKAEALGKFFTKGQQFVLHGQDVESDCYPKKDGTGYASKIKCKVVDLVPIFNGNGQQQQHVTQQPQYNKTQPQYNQNQQQAQEVQPPQPVEQPVSDDDIPF